MSRATLTDEQKKKQVRLDQIKAAIVKDNICPELAKNANHMVFGHGNPDAEIVFIGEAPGKKEDETGLPFVGTAGRFLDEMLQGIGLARKDVYISNIVKYRPPHNRDPLPEEKKAFLPYLQRQLEVIRPKLVVTLGRHSTNCFLPDLKISKIHGEAKRIRISMKESDDILTIVILPLFHPAAALYNGGMRQMLIDDFARLPNVIKQVKAQQ